MILVKDEQMKIKDFLDWMYVTGYRHDPTKDWGIYDNCSWVFVDLERHVYVHGKPDVAIPYSEQIDVETAKNIIRNQKQRSGGAVWYIRTFCEINEGYSFYENYKGSYVGVVVKNGYSYMDMLFDITKFFDDTGFGDPDLELQSTSIDEFGEDDIVYFPFVRNDP